MKQIIEKLKEQIANSIEYGNDLDAASWGMQEGVLISANEAPQIVEALEGMEERRAFTLPKGEEVNGSRLCDGRASRHKRLLNHKS